MSPALKRTRLMDNSLSKYSRFSLAFASSALACKVWHESAAQVEKQRAFQVQLLRFRDGGALLRALQAQFPLVLAFVQVVEREQREQIAEGTIGSSRGREGLYLIDAHGHVRIRPQIGGDLVRLGFLDIQLARAQVGVVRFELVFHLLPRQRFLRGGLRGCRIA